MGSTKSIVVALWIGSCLLGIQNVAAQQATQRNPFEAVPEPPQSSPPLASGPTIEAIEFRGAKRVPQFVLRALVVSRAGGIYDLETLRRDAEALRRTGRFSDVVWETEPSRTGAIVRFTVAERPLILAVEYQGDDNTLTMPEILERFKQRKIFLGVQTLLHEDELGRAAAAIQELLTERGLQNSRVTPVVEPVRPPSTVKVIFRVEQKE